MDAVYGALALITLAMTLGALQALAGQRVRVERAVSTWNWAGDGGEAVVRRDGFEGKLASVRLGDGGRELVLEFACEDMDRAVRAREPAVDSLGPVVSVWSAWVT